MLNTLVPYLSFRYMVLLMEYACTVPCVCLCISLCFCSMGLCDFIYRLYTDLDDACVHMCRQGGLD